ncbi:N-acyl-D-amino-acid deacylase family protein [Actinocorallia sp. A-T 12471]|uniref:N-acyl-D-amino-acid deacylase family protein n=1 Tax=Actinocorallia sp. A-T 12471 TaxID=3089813 RepID=UPI0029CB2DD1|nr:amidohydrolase family protein [Actinocorallia sp. A-T 12471]MDX6740700.1 amidohydrolase family protein [Actinocorallia sp. A-T 12471]
MAYDTVIRGGLWFDGTGGPSAVRDLGIKDGRVVAVSAEPLDASGARVIDAEGKWVMPGFIDIHTHYDAEVLAAPGLGESLRHGVTTVVFGSCSLSTVHVDPLDAADLFSRVEAVPREHVIRSLEERGGWKDAAGYIAALEELPLGPNVTAFLGHSDLRAAVMGLGRATDKSVKPSAAELRRMELLLVDALKAGMLGLSEMRNPWDKLDGDRYRSRTLPSTFATRAERRRLHRIVRSAGRVLQSIPNLVYPVQLLPALVESIGRGKRKPLKTSFLTAADVKANPLVMHIMGPLAKAVNRLGADFRWQHLPVPFQVYADGIDLVVFEEFGSGAAALHLKDQVERNALLQDESYRRRFRRDYENKWTPRVWHRDLYDAHIVACPDDSVVGRTFGQVGDERSIHPVDAFLDLVVEHGPKVRWHTTISNHRPAALNKLSSLPEVQMGFSDAGAHLRNMAFYNFPLRLLRRAHTEGFMSVERAVHRLTGELAAWYNLDAGFLRQGDRADLVIVNPTALDATLDEPHEAPADAYNGLIRMVNRNDATVTAVLVAGTPLFANGTFTPAFGTHRTGRFLRPTDPPGTVDPQTLPTP